MEFRLLKSDEIECRIGSVSKQGKGLSLLLYKNARCDMALLDETVGVFNWQRDHFECKGNLFCKVGIKNDNEWVWKADAGKESNTEAEKGEASDSFKRACVNWGIGRELYTSPFIWIDSSNCNITNNKCYDRFEVSAIGYSKERKINHLIIINSKSKTVVFEMGKPEPKEEFDTSERASDLNIKNIKIMLEETDTDVKKFLEYYKVKAVDELSIKDYNTAVKQLEKKKIVKKPVVSKSKKLSELV